MDTNERTTEKFFDCNTSLESALVNSSLFEPGASRVPWFAKWQTPTQIECTVVRHRLQNRLFDSFLLEHRLTLIEAFSYLHHRHHRHRHLHSSLLTLVDRHCYSRRFSHPQKTPMIFPIARPLARLLSHRTRPKYPVTSVAVC
ncbi:hypothetical protein D3C80_1791230 [compost metagenome]